MGEVKVKICPFGLVVLIPIDMRKTGNYKTGTCRNWQKIFGKNSSDRAKIEIFFRGAASFAKFKIWEAKDG